MHGPGFTTPDFHALAIQHAANLRGVPSRFGLLPQDEGPSQMWLQLLPGRRAYFYRLGALRRALPDRPGWIGDPINGDAALLTMDKAATKALLAAAGISTPTGSVFGREQLPTALAFFRRLGGPVCLKPNDGRKGKLVFPRVREESALEAAFGSIAAAGREVLVERSVPGEVVRFFYVRPSVVAVKLSRCASVLGDGRHSIAALIAIKNRRRAERQLPGHLPIELSQDLLAFLAADGRTLEDVPAEGERVPLSATSNGATGADSIACAGAIHPSYAALVEKAGAVFPDLVISAADVMVRDHRMPATADNYWLLELNTSPGVLPYHFPWQGRPQDVSGAILDYILKDAEAA